jgi:hypothetical protein
MLASQQIFVWTSIIKAKTPRRAGCRIGIGFNKAGRTCHGREPSTFEGPTHIRCANLPQAQRAIDSLTPRLKFK